MGRRMKRQSPLPINYYEWQRRTILFACRNRRLQEVLPQAQAKDNGRDGKRKMLCGTTRLYSTCMGCRNPVQWPSCFIALFSLFEFSKNWMQNARNTMANFASMKRSSKQVQKFLLHKHVTALSSSNRSPRPSKPMYPQLLFLSHYLLLELAVALLEAVEFSAGK